MPIKISAKPPSITVQFSPEDFDMIHQFAWRCGASPAQVTKLAILRLITQAERGEIPNLLPEFRTGIAAGNA